MITNQQCEIIKAITKKYNPVLIGIFGSYARNEQTQESDIDILMDFELKLNLIELIGIEQDLSSQLGIKVDLVTLNSVNQHLKSYIEKDLIRIV